MNRPLFFLSLLIMICHSAGADTLDSVRSEIRKVYLIEQPSQPVDNLVSTINEDGHWNDIDYSDISTSLWQLERHLDRIVDMALVYEQKSTKDSELAVAINKGLKYWFDGKFRNPNWWYTKIGIPRQFLKIAYILDDDISTQLRDTVANVISIIDSDDFPARPGGDRIQVISNHAKALLWKRDYEGAISLFKKIQTEADFAPDEETMYDAAGGQAVRNAYRPSGRGVQADMTFHHRGDRVNSTITYGLELPEFFSEWASLLLETEYGFSAESIRFIIDYYLDGICRHLVCGRYIEPSAINRELSRRGAKTINPDIVERLMRISNGYRHDELRYFAEAQRGASFNRKSYAVHFWQSDYFVFSRPTFQAAVRFHSNRTSNQEAPHNYEGIRNHFRGDGACMLSINGCEYTDIAPITDFRKIPGTTTPLIQYNPLVSWGPVQILDNPTIFAGAVSDSIFGAVAFDFISPRSDLRARKSWFFFDEGYLCMGSGINYTGADTIVTTIEQSFSPSASMRTNPEKDWFFHSGNAYHIIDGNAVGALELKRGTWNNCVDNVSYANDSVADHLFTLYINHGVKPIDASYAYVVLPETDSPVPLGFKIISHNENIHAASTTDDSLIYINFFNPGSIETAKGDFEVSKPCIMMIRDGIVSLADPTRTIAEIEIKSSSGSHKVVLPTGKRAGTEVRVAI